MVIWRRHCWPSAVGGILAAGPALATGGHHAVDDATILAPGRCHVESWGEFERGGDYVATVSPACNFGGLEWTLGLQQERADGAGAWGLAPQVTAAWPIGQSPWSVGAVLAAEWGERERAWQSTTLLVPLSLAAAGFDLHFNLGYDWVHGEPDDWRYGASVYRNLAGPLAGVFGTFKEAGLWHGQVALRWYSGQEGLSVDLGVTGIESGSRDGWASLGVNYEFGR
jgi:hypothetical protein